MAPAVAAVVLTGAGVLLTMTGLSHASPPPNPSRADAAPAVTRSLPDPSAGDSTARDLHARTLPRSAPTRLTITSIGVDTGPLVRLGVDAHGSLDVPRRFDQAGWYTPGPWPGQYGPAVIAGHVDSTTGPGVFYRLGALHKSAVITVALANGSVARFTVDRVVSYAKSAFPTSSVYGDTTHRAELRLITCGGRFDTRSGHYLNNIVAYAHLL